VPYWPRHRTSSQHKIGLARPAHQRDGVCKTGETLAEIALMRMVGPPLACAVGAGLAIFRIADDLPLAALAAAPLLAGRIRAGDLLRVKSGWFELPLTKRASQIHPY
jgi:hypothetical protein